MKKITAIILAVFCFFAVPAVSGFAQDAWQDGVYEGEGQGFIGPIRVSVTVSGGKMSKIEILETNETNMEPPMNFWAMAHPEIVNRILDKQSPEVDVVSGATYASRGISDAVSDALKKAAGEPVEEDAVFEKTVTAKNRHNDDPADAPMAEMLQPDAVVERIGGKYYATLTFGKGFYGWSSLDGSHITSVKALAANGSTYVNSTADKLDAANGTHQFTVPITTMEGQQIQVDTSAPLVGMRNLRLYFTDRVPEAVDKQPLAEAIQSAEALKESDYTAESWKAFQKALEDARTVYGDADAAKAEVSKALQALQNAQGGLVVKKEDAHYWVSCSLQNSWNGAESAMGVLLSPVAEIEVKNSQTYAAVRFVPGNYNEYEVTGTDITKISVPDTEDAEILESDKTAGVREFKLELSDPAQPVRIEVSSDAFPDKKETVLLSLGERLPEQPADSSTLKALVYQADLLTPHFYTKESYASLTQAATEAKEILKQGSAIQDALNQHSETVRKALNTLSVTKETVDIDSLELLRSAAKSAPKGAKLRLTRSLESDGNPQRIVTRNDLTLDGQGYTLNGKSSAGLFYVQGGKLTLKNITLQNARYRFEGLYDGKGSAVLAENGDLRMENCTVIGCMSSFGNVYVGENRQAEIIHCTFAGNSATNGASICFADTAKGTLANSILAGGASMSEIYFSGTPALTDGGYNLVTSLSTKAGQFPGETSVVDASFYDYSAWLTPVDQYQPEEKTLPLLPSENHPALDKIPAGQEYLLEKDQTGTVRPQGKKGDIGAYELPSGTLEPDQVKIDSSAFTVVKRGTQMKLSAVFTPEYASSALTWSSSNPAVASVSADGLVSALKPGTTTVHVKTANGKTHAVTVRVTL